MKVTAYIELWGYVSKILVSRNADMTVIHLTLNLLTCFLPKKIKNSKKI